MRLVICAQLPIEDAPKAFFVRVVGNDLRPYGVFHGDVLLVEKGRAIGLRSELVVKENCAGLTIETLPAGSVVNSDYGVVTKVIRDSRMKGVSSSISRG